MRLSSLADDSGYLRWKELVVDYDMAMAIFLDGVFVEICHMADEERGVISIVTVNDETKYFFGNVEIKLYKEQNDQTTYAKH